MYAPLTYFVVFLGSMGTGEDLFYKCYAHSGELSTHSNTHKKFLLEIWNTNYEYLFLEEKQYYYLYILIDIYQYS